MAVLAYTGFELGDSVSEFLSSGPVVEPVATVQRTGKFSIRFNDTVTRVLHLKKPNGTSGKLLTNSWGTTCYITFWLRLDTAPTGDVVIFYWDAGELLLKTNKTLQLHYDSGSGLNPTFTVVGSDSPVLTTGVWHRIDIKAVFTSANVYDTELKVDAASIASATGLSEPRHSNLNDGNAFQFGLWDTGDTTLDYYLDDIIVRDNAYQSDNGGVLIMRPDSVGNYTAWTGTWSDVDEVPASTSDDIHATAVSQAETEGLRSAATSGIAGTITAVANYACLYNVGTTGLPTISLRMRTGTTDTDATADSAGVGTSGRRLWSSIHETNPSTSSAWTLSDLDSLEVGVVAVTGPTGDNLPTASVVGAMVWCSLPQSILAPVVSSISPTSGPKAGGTAVTITGENFTGATSALIGGNAGTSFTVVSDTSITCTTAAAAKAGAYNVTVVSPNGTGTLLNGFTFTPGNSNGQSGNNATGGTTLVVTMPTTATGEQLIAVITVRGTATTVSQASWGTAIDIRSDGTNTSTHTFKRISTGASEPASYTFTIGTSGKASGVITSTPDVDTLAGPRVSSQANASSANVVAPTLTPRRRGSVSIYGGGTATGTTFTPPTNYTEPANSDNASTGGSVGTRTTTEQAYRQLADLTATGTLTGVAGAAATNVGVQVMLDPPTVADIKAIGSAEAIGTPSIVQAQLTLIIPSAIASAGAIGSHTLLPGGVNVLPSAIASAEAIGSYIVKPTNLIDLVNQAIASAEALGTPILYSLATILPSAIASTEAIGSHTLLPGGVFILPSAVGSAEALGTPNLYALASILPSAIASAESIGSPILLPGGVLVVPSGITSAQALGATTLYSLATIAPNGIVTAELLGTPTLFPGNTLIIPTGVLTGEVIGAAVLSAIARVLPSAINTAEAIGSAIVLPGGVRIIPSGIDTSETLGAALLTAIATIAPSAIGSGELFTPPILLPGGVQIIVSGIGSAETIGSHVLVVSGNVALFILPNGILSSEVLGSATVLPGGVTVQPSSIQSDENVVSPAVLPGAVLIVPTAVGSAEALGGPVILPGSVVITPQGVLTGEAVPAPTLLPGGIIVIPVAISSEEVIGAAIISALSKILPPGISSTEIFGTAEFLPGPIVISPTGLPSAEELGSPIVVRFLVGSWQWLNRSPGWQTTRIRGFPSMSDSKQTTDGPRWPHLEDAMKTTDEGGDDE